MAATAAGFLLTSFSLFNLSFVGQFLLQQHAINHRPAPPFPTATRIRNLEVFAPSGHMAFSQGQGSPRGFLISYTSPTSSLPAAAVLLQSYLELGPGFIEPLVHEVGWAMVVVDVFTKKILLATDRFGTKPIFFAARTNDTEDRGFAISSHPSALHRLGFTIPSEVKASTVMLLDLVTAQELSTSNLVTMLAPSLPKRSNTPAIDRMDLFKQSLKDQLAWMKGLARVCTMVYGHYSIDHDLLVSALRDLPIGSLSVYQVSPSDDMVYRTTFSGAQRGETEIVHLQADKALDYLEPSLTASANISTLTAISTMFQDARASGISMYLSAANAFHIDLSSAGGALTAVLRMEEFISQAYGIDIHRPLLLQGVLEGYESLELGEREAIKAVTWAISEDGSEGEGPMMVDEDHEQELSPIDVNDLSAIFGPLAEAWMRGDKEGARAPLLKLLDSSAPQRNLSAPARARMSDELGYTYRMDGHILEAIKWYCDAIVSDPTYHTAYSHFVGLGAGIGAIREASVTMNQEVVKLLRSKIEEMGTDPLFREMALYNLGQALFYSKADEAEIEQVYSQIIHVPVSGGSTKAMERVPEGRPGESVIVMTVASRRTPELDNLIESAKFAGVDLRVLGEGMEYKGHAVKLQLYWEFTARDDIEDDQLLIATDAYDVLLSPSIRDVPMILRDFERPIIFAAERGCWPDPGVSTIYKAAGVQDAGYLNSGTFVGRKQDLYRMLKEVLSYKAQFDDQRLLTRFYLEHPELVQLDISSKIFYTLHDNFTPVLIDQSSRIYVPGLGHPALFHGNGGDGKQFYSLLALGWRQSIQTNAPTFVANYAYRRGFSHRSRGQHALALACFLSHMAHRPEIPGETAYATARTLHDLEEYDLARVFYRRSLEVGPHDETQSAALHLSDMEQSLGLLEPALTAVTKALSSNPSNNALLVLEKALLVEQQPHHHLGLTPNPLNVSALALSSMQKAYQPEIQDAHDFIDILGGHLGQQLSFLANSRLQISQAFYESTYLSFSRLLCKASEDLAQPLLVDSQGFPFDRVFRLMHLVGTGDTAAFCEEFGRGLVEEGSAAATITSSA